MPNTLVLRALTGDLRGQEFAVKSPAHCILGRSRKCSLRLPGDATVSRQHCLIEIDNRGAWVQDLGSLNGTLVNGSKISPVHAPADSEATHVQSARQELNDGDELRICNNIFAVCFKDTLRKLESSRENHLALGV